MAITYRSDIDGLRAISVLPVLFFHFGIQAISGGFTGVDVFFVISGYVITSTLYRQMLDGTFSILNFYERRIRRIFPAMLVVVTVTMVAGFFNLWPSEYVRLAQSAGAAVVGFANIFFYLNTGYFDQSSHLLPLLHMWSLAVEEQFYFVWPPLLLLALVIGRRSKSFAAASAVGVILISFAAAVYGVLTNPSGAFYLPHYRAWELAVGALLVFLPSPIGRGTASQVAAASGLAMLAYGFFALTDRDPFPGVNALFPSIGAALLIWSGSAGTFAASILSTRTLVFIGRISYSLYLWHWPLVVFYRHATGVAVLTPGDAAGLTVASALLAYASYRYVEIPLRKDTGPLAGRRRTFGSAAAAAALLIAASATIFVTGGFGGRLEAQVQRVLAYSSYNPKDQFRIGQCFLDVGNDLSDFDLKTCLPSGSRIAVLWGDSTVAHYYAGMVEPFQQRGYVLGQFTASLCPPIPHHFVDQRPNCAPFNDFAYAQIRNAKPDILVLGAVWPLDPQSLESLKAVLRTMIDAGTKVVVLGPVPSFTHNIPTAIADRIRQHATGIALDHMAYDQGPVWIDDALRQRVAGINGARFISTMKLLCPNELCVVMTEAGDPLYIDRNHVNDIGSKALGPHLVDAILAQRN
jgi:peptidoglycan/LPS O-acetylase OafA/YrhL